ncbi:ribosome-recycling factor, mitochondrial [Amyelois transitella]|uniref:ribosome-recycling factor, mitochondrial n=1 Tax=Amyelois transitella TaxID=680683 RepID=UPI00067CB33A|nr:ribosome-recycling factor, mitochondrial [Amyelois transitella]
MNLSTRIIGRVVIPSFINSTRTVPLNFLRINTVPLVNKFNFTPSRNYAKSKDKGKDKKGKGGKVEINPQMMSELIPVDKLKERSISVIDKMKEDFAKNLSLRSTTGSIESLPVKFEGKDYELQELAQIVRKNPKTIVINFASFPQAIPDALKSIQSSGLNLNPQQDGTTVYVPVPKVTKEHRETLAKNAKALYIKCRDSLKDIQNEYLKKLKKQTGVSEDLVFNVTKQLAAMCEDFQTSAKSIYEQKHNELIGKDK